MVLIARRRRVRLVIYRELVHGALSMHAGGVALGEAKPSL
jgi:hypothetical protein